MALGHLPVMINPAGAVYNPVSVSGNLDMIISKKVFTAGDLYNNDGLYLSFFHNTEFSSWDPEKVLRNINDNSGKAHEFLSVAKYLFVTFGTARVYKLRTSGQIVSNCHKLPSGLFIPELLSVDQIVTLWSELLEKLNAFNPSLKVVFTISPVRHWKDGAHGNQVSKSTLFLAVEELLKNSSSPGYFPAYELVMDDLRDYRFYGADMLHPSAEAVNYIWDLFAATYIENKTFDTWKELYKISRAVEHNLLTDSPAGISMFAKKMLKKLEIIALKTPSIDLCREKDYFLTILGGK
jgi:hypothetical protein